MIEPTLTMHPRLAASMRAPNARQHRKTPVRSTSRTSAQSSSVKVSDGPILLIPALFTRTVASPSASATATAAASTDAVERTSSAKPGVLRPDLRRDPLRDRHVVVGDGDAGARVGERLCDRPADPVPRSGDDRDLAVERAHRV